MRLRCTVNRGLEAGVASLRRSTWVEVSEHEVMTPVVKLVNVILVDSIKRGASHVRVERRQGRSSVAFRINDAWVDVMSLPVHVHAPVVRRVKSMAGIVLSEPPVLQTGCFRIRALLETRPCEFAFAVSTLLTDSGDGILLERTEGSWPSLSEEC